jgi:hypothetical protein
MKLSTNVLRSIHFELVHRISQSLTLANRIILDGEMLVWDPVSEQNLPFGTLKTAALGTHMFATMLNLTPCVKQTNLESNTILVHAVGPLVKHHSY